MTVHTDGACHQMWMCTFRVHHATQQKESHSPIGLGQRYEESIFYTPKRSGSWGIEEFTYDYRYELSREIHAMATLTAAVDVVLTETPTSNTLEVNPKLEV